MEYTWHLNGTAICSNSSVVYIVHTWHLWVRNNITSAHIYLYKKKHCYMVLSFSTLSHWMRGFILAYVHYGTNQYPLKLGWHFIYSLINWISFLVFLGGHTTAINYVVQAKHSFPFLHSHIFNSHSHHKPQWMVCWRPSVFLCSVVCWHW